MPKLFLISGLGADERLFKNLDLSAFEVVPVTWLKPQQTDSLATYAKKLIGQFDIVPGSNVIGVSLGGMLTVEIARQVNLQHAIIISSIKSGIETPWYFAFFRAVPVHKIISGKFVKSLGPLMRPFFRKFAGNKEAPLFYSMLQNSIPEFLTWAIRAVLEWTGEPVSAKIDHIVGDADLIFNHRRIKDAIVIPKGDHMMVFTRAAQINPLIQNILNG